tara:strand:+ start:1200 stop:2201 length:1002 start_codon:yes stop_codon:yes gene_type:complete
MSMNLIKKTNRIFIAGHKGMVGSSIKKKLIQLSYKNLQTPSREELDLLDNKSVENWFKNNMPEVVILAAAKVGGIEANSKYPADFIFENLKIQTNIIENSWKNNVKRFIFLGSSCIYPKFAEQPIKENYLLTGKLENTNEPYAISKIAGIKLCASLKTQYDFDAISLMPTNLYGPGDNYHSLNSHVVPSLIRKFHDAKINNKPHVTCWGTGSPKREFLHVDDIAEAVVFVLEKVSSDNKNLFEEDLKYTGLLNVGVGKDMSIKELAELIATNLDYRGRIYWDDSKPDGTPRKLLDVSKLNRLGWTSKIDIESGIRLTIKSFKNELNENTIRFK